MTIDKLKAESLYQNIIDLMMDDGCAHDDKGEMLFGVDAFLHVITASGLCLIDADELERLRGDEEHYDLWATYSIGPDEIFAQPSLHEAIKQARIVNNMLEDSMKEKPSDYWPFVFVSVVNWRGPREEHAACLQRQAEDKALLTATACEGE